MAPQFNIPAARGLQPINANLPNVDFNPAPQANFIDSALQGLERGQTMGLRARQQVVQEEQLALQKKKQEDQDFDSFTNSLLSIHKLPKSIQPEYWKGVVAPKASKVGFDLDPNSFEEEDRSTLDEAVQLIEAHKKDPKLVTKDDVRGGFQILAMKATKAGDDTSASKFMDVAKQYSGNDLGKSFYFVDPSTKEMFDPNLQPISQAPENATPRMLSNPNQSNEGVKRNALVKSAINSVNIAKNNLTPKVLDEIKGIKFTPGKVYQQLASPEAKRFYRNISNAISSELYLKTGAAATQGEVDQRALIYMPAANDDVNDMRERLDMLHGEAANFGSESDLKETSPKKDSLGLFK